MTPAEALYPHWLRLRDKLAPALEREGWLFSLDDVWQAVQNEQAQFWPGQNSAVVTEIRIYPATKVLNVWLAGGELDEIRQMLPLIRQFGHMNHCSKITMQGRKGWARALGMQAHSIVLQESL